MPQNEACCLEFGNFIFAFLSYLSVPFPCPSQPQHQQMKSGISFTVHPVAISSYDSINQCSLLTHILPLLAASWETCNDTAKLPCPAWLEERAFCAIKHVANESSPQRLSSSLRMPKTPRPEKRTHLLSVQKQGL